MPIALSCHSCKSQYQIPDEFAGRQTKCRKCGATLQIPGAAPARAPAAAGGAVQQTPGAAPPPAGELEFAAGASPVAVQAYRRKATGKSRRGLWIALAVIALLAVGGAAAAYWFFWPAGQLGESVRYLPTNTRFVALVRVDNLMAGGSWTEVENRLPDFKKWLDNLEQNTGLARADIDQIMIGSTLSRLDERLMIIRTKRDISAADIRAREEYAPFTEVQVGKYTMYEGSALGVPAALALCVPESRVLLLGDTDVMRPVLERDKRPSFMPDMKDRIADADFSRPVAFALNLNKLTIRGVYSGVKIDLQDTSLEGAAGQLDPGSPEQATITFVVETVPRAAHIHKTLQGQFKEIKVRRGSRQELAEAVDAVQLRTDENKVIVTAPLPQALLLLRAYGFLR